VTCQKFSDAKHRAACLRQLSFLSVCLGRGVRSSRAAENTPVQRW